jgi:murein DD-endopeptidase MepM/ murein hydrolase activator NlpD
MRGDKGVILAQDFPLVRMLMWFAAIAVVPTFSVVAAFGVAPGTLIESPTVEHVVQEIALPTPIALDHSSDTRFIQEDRIERGDTVAALLAKLSVDDPSAVKFLRSAKAARPFARLRAGRTMRAETSSDRELLSLTYLTRSGIALQLERQGGDFKVSEKPADLDVRSQMASGEIRSSLFAATDAAGLPDAIAIQIAEIFSSHIDFHRDLRRGDRFAVVYEGLYHGSELVRTGRVLAAEFINRGKSRQAVWFDSADGRGGYYTPDGNSLRKAFLRSPLEFSRISSGFSRARFHPILRTWTAHRGIDYAAPAGTRVRTTGDGVVTFAGRKGGYGNLVIVQHARKFSTYYAHLSRFAGGLRKGVQVAQGDFIGYVGQTGLATGPHLHYEFHINGVQRDPLKVVLPEAVPLSRKLRATFDAHAAPLAHQVALLRTANIANTD